MPWLRLAVLLANDAADNLGIVFVRVTSPRRQYTRCFSLRVCPAGLRAYAASAAFIGCHEDEVRECDGGRKRRVGFSLYWREKIELIPLRLPDGEDSQKAMMREGRIVLRVDAIGESG